jgi:predicted acylesterase/phospholipase RssA
MSSASAAPAHRIGLALSGGGFRASLFHLGVIRRLEELGIMEDVSIVSAVSGGSIVAAFYLCEMEKELRESRLKRETADRVVLFERIAERFLKAVEHNLRTRALIFTPFYHPVSFVKYVALKAFRRGARAELIQAEYDKFFFYKDTLDQLPVERPRKDEEPEAVECVKGGLEPYYGPRLLLNTTSLLTGQRTTFSRDTSSGIVDLKTSDKNVLRLSQVVGASSGVPVLFPPTAICGDLLVDGGVADNQGIEGLLTLDKQHECNVLLVSDASGQMGLKHTLSTSETAVYLRVNEIYQFQIRNKLLDQLLAWAPKEQNKRSFAFIHLLVNLKSRRGSPPRVSTDILPALGRIRTDLDQFSPVECEALMYHGYTLIDAQLKGYCCHFLQERYPEFSQRKLKTPPLFRTSTQARLAKKSTQEEETPSTPIRRDLEAGSTSSFLLRCLKKHPWSTTPAFLLDLALFFYAVRYAFQPSLGILGFVQRRLEAILHGAVPDRLAPAFSRFLEYFGFGNLSATIDSVSQLLAVILVVGLVAYLVSFPLYRVVRRMTMWLDLRTYKKITGGKSPTVHWAETEEEPEAPAAETTTQ